jgi:ribosomal protein S18 acetylase RimI-like enzyme
VRDKALLGLLDQRNPRMAAQIVAVQHAAYRTEAQLIGFDDIPPLHETAADVMQLDLTLLGIIDGGELAALLGYRRRDLDVEIDRLAVHPSSFRRGFARRLIEELHRREAVATRFDVSTGRDNVPALTLYLQLGYQPVGEVDLPEGVTITRLARVVDHSLKTSTMEHGEWPP